VLELARTHERNGACRANPEDKRKIDLTDWTRVDQHLDERAREKINRYTKDYAKNARTVFAPAVASTSGRMQSGFLRLLFLHAHREDEKHVKHILGMNDVAAQPKSSWDYFNSKCAAFLNALKCKPGLILAKAADMRITIWSPHTSPLPLPCTLLLHVAACLCMQVLLIMNFVLPRLELDLRGEQLALQGSCAFLALLMVNISLSFCSSMLGLHNTFYA
jgi:hypothetical protein